MQIFYFLIWITLLDFLISKIKNLKYKIFLLDLSMKVHPSSVVNLMLANLDSPAPKYILYNDIVQAKTTYLMRDISVIDFNWLQELIPEYYEFGTARQIHETNEAKRPRIKY